MGRNAGKEEQMTHLSKTQILLLRSRGYPLEGDNWLMGGEPASYADELKVARLIDGDTLAIVHIPVDILQQIKH